MDASNKIYVPKGLAGVVADESAVSKVMAESNSLTYRGYPVEELSAHCSFEEVAYLLIYGELPNVQQKEAFLHAEKSKRAISADLLKVVQAFPKSAHLRF